MVISRSWIREKNWYSISERKPQGEWDILAELMMITLVKADPVFRATSPLSRWEIVITQLRRPGND